MDNKKIQKIKIRIKGLSRELSECVDELSILLEGDFADTGATDEDMGVKDQLTHLLNNQG